METENPHVLYKKGLEICDMSEMEADKLYGRIKLKDSYDYRYKVPNWQLGAETEDKRSSAHELFLLAGRGYQRIGKSEEALKAFYLSYWVASLSKGKDFREREIKAIHMITDVLLFYTEKGADEVYSEVNIRRKENRHANITAAKHFEWLGYLYEEENENKKALSTYRTAVFKYEIANDIDSAIHTFEFIKGLDIENEEEKATIESEYLDLIKKKYNKNEEEIEEGSNGESIREEEETVIDAIINTADSHRQVNTDKFEELILEAAEKYHKMNRIKRQTYDNRALIKGVNA